jgi:phosphoglycerate dehydrogenase-like enzyme
MLAITLLLAAATSGGKHVALIGKQLWYPSAFILDRMNDAESWTFLMEADNPDAKQLATVDACVQSSLTTLNDTLSATLYQYQQTGYAESDLQQIPARFTVANCHHASIPIAEYVMANVLEQIVHVKQMDGMLHNCTWKDAPPGNACPELPPHRQAANLTLGIIGYGHIGAAIATRAAAFGMRIIATTLDPAPAPPPPLSWLGDDSMNGKLARESDFVVVACPLTNSTTGMVGGKIIAQMKQSAVLINVGRGAVVDEDSLFNALANRALAGAVLDVW